MRIGPVVFGAAALVLLAACGGSPETPPVSMPSVTGERLDVAYSDLSAVGVEQGDVEVVGGGTFGVLDESNWQVCEQRPAAGAEIANVRLVIDRSCPDASGTSGSGQSATSFTMPSLVGMGLQDAQDALQSQGSYLLDQQDASGLGRLQMIDSNWKVCTQSPAAGSEVGIQSTVQLGAVKLEETCPGADGPPSAQGTPAAATSGTMPDVVGMVLQDAQDLLQSKGSYLMDQVDATGQSRFQLLDSNWVVCAQEPASGEALTATTMVRLSAVKLDESCP